MSVVLEDMVIDFETYSECDLKECGATVYAQHSSTEILCMSYRTKDMPKAKVWVPGREPFPQLVLDHINNSQFIEAHNAGFERAIWKYVLMQWKNLPEPRQEIPWPRRWKDSMAVCAYHALPQSLDDVGDVLNLDTKKDKRGKYLLQKLSRPQKPTKKNPERRCNDPLLLEELYTYCGNDADTEWALKEMIGNLPPPEYKIWVLDQIINDRGVCVDTDTVNAAIKVVELVENALNKELFAITGGMVSEGTKLPAMKEWFATQGCAVGDLTADTVKRALDRKDLAPVVRRVFQIRQTLSKASAKKLVKFLSCCAADGRAHGLLQYHGAGTGRWAGRLIQPQNFPRGDETILSLFSAIFGEADEQGMVGLIESIRTVNPDYLDILYGDAMNAIASALRGMIIAGPGNKFYVADFAAIEARVTAWLYNEEWKLDAFIEVDRGNGYKGSDDMYCAAAAMIFGHPVSKKLHKALRQIGKMCELAFGYQGGIGAWRNFDTRQEGDPGYVDDDTVDSYKVAWREAHPNIVAGWYGVEETAINAVRFEGPFSYAYVTYEKVVNAAGTWLTCTLPNGRKLWYYNPKVESYIDKWGREKWELTYEGKDNKRGGMWGRIKTYGGMLTENIVQAISRDLMVEAMIRVEQAGYPIVLTVHDEIICETKSDFGSSEEFDTLMCVVPPWADGCPITASGWTGIRYHKE
jgi:DNA polymerase